MDVRARPTQSPHPPTQLRARRHRLVPIRVHGSARLYRQQPTTTRSRSSRRQHARQEAAIAVTVPRPHWTIPSEVPRRAFQMATGLCAWSTSRDQPTCSLACSVLRSVAAGPGRRGLPPGTWCWSGRWRGTRILYRRSWGWVGGIRVGGRRSRIAGCSDVRSCRCLTRATGTSRHRL
jgi:hypothetical protein